MGFFSKENDKTEPQKTKIESYIEKRNSEELARLEEKAAKIIITTVDINRNYEIIGVASAKDSKELRMIAARDGADAIVGYRIIECMDNSHYHKTEYGTIVKFI